MCHLVSDAYTTPNESQKQQQIPHREEGVKEKVIKHRIPHMDPYALKAVTDLPAHFRSAFSFRVRYVMLKS
ncbi:hypothetical protein ACS0TY_026327 [Phlomoides rotata]